MQAKQHKEINYLECELVYAKIDEQWKKTYLLEYDYKRRPSAPFKVYCYDNRQVHVVSLNDIKSISEYLMMEDEEGNEGKFSWKIQL